MTAGSWPQCPECLAPEVEVLHEQSPEAATTHATLRCLECGHTFKDVIETPKDLEVACVISQGAESRHSRITLPSDDRVRVDDEIFGDDHRLLVTAIEHEDGRRVKSAPVGSIKTLWCKVFDKITLNISVNKGHITHADEMEVVPEEEFYVGDELTIHGQDVRVHAIKTEQGIRHHGSAQAREIVRMFAERVDFSEARKRGNLEEHKEYLAHRSRRQEQKRRERQERRGQGRSRSQTDEAGGTSETSQADDTGEETEA